MQLCKLHIHKTMRCAICLYAAVARSQSPCRRCCFFFVSIPSVWRAKVCGNYQFENETLLLGGFCCVIKYICSGVQKMKKKMRFQLNSSRWRKKSALDSYYYLIISEKVKQLQLLFFFYCRAPQCRQIYVSNELNKKKTQKITDETKSKHKHTVQQTAELRIANGLLNTVQHPEFNIFIDSNIIFVRNACCVKKCSNHVYITFTWKRRAEWFMLGAEQTKLWFINTGATAKNPVDLLINWYTDNAQCERTNERKYKYKCQFSCVRWMLLMCAEWMLF